MVFESDIVILGAGLTGLAAGVALGPRATVLEAETRPGGLVRMECFDGYWFEHVSHLLYFPDKKTEKRIKALVGDTLARCQPVAFAEALDGVCRYPFQMHLGGLSQEALVKALHDFAEVTFGKHQNPLNFEEMLLSTFGRGMCETFLLPYNEKIWKRPLSSLSSSGFHWNIARPNFEEVLKGVLTPDWDAKAYNSQAWYPRPAKDAPLRGCETISQALASELSDLRLEHRVQSIDLEKRQIEVEFENSTIAFEYRDACLGTLPLPLMLEICKQAPEELQEEAKKLRYNRVLTLGLSVRGPRPTDRGHWRYYADPSVSFNRLLYLHQFDPDLAPTDGWPMLLEITERAEDPISNEKEVLKKAREDVEKVGALPADCEIIAERVVHVASPAYVVFTNESKAIAERIRKFFRERSLTPLGRYGNWEYSSMALVMRDGFDWAEAQLAAYDGSERQAVGM